MSLKSHLNKGPVKFFMDRYFDNLRPFVRDWETGRPADWNAKSLFPYVKIEKYLLLGTAYDTYVRASIAQNRKDAAFLDGMYDFLRYMGSNKQFAIHHGIDASFIHGFKKKFDRMILQESFPDLDLIIELATFEEAVRGFHSRVDQFVFPTKQQRAEIKEELEKFDLCSNRMLLKSIGNQPLVHGKDFGAYSQLLGGADLDLITKDTIIDMKTNRFLRFESKDWHQVIAYAFLNQLDNPGEQINKVSIYYARYDKLFYIDLNDLDFQDYLSDFKMMLSTLNT